MKITSRKEEAQEELLSATVTKATLGSSNHSNALVVKMEIEVPFAQVEDRLRSARPQTEEDIRSILSQMVKVTR